MKIPKKLKIGGQVYTVHLQNRKKVGGTDSLGTSNIYSNMGIWLDITQSPTQLESTFFHEIIEIINAFNKLGLDEKDICILETNFYQILKDNKLLK